MTNLRRQQWLALEAGIESAVVARVTYMHRLDASWLGKDSRAVCALRAAGRRARLRRLRLRCRAAHATLGDDWGMQLVLGGVVRNTTNTLFNATALGLRALVLPGYQSDTGA